MLVDEWAVSSLVNYCIDAFLWMTLFVNKINL